MTTAVHCAPLAALLRRCCWLALALAIACQADASAPVDTCSGAFCTTLDLATFDALAPTQPTTAAAQPTNLALRFTDTSAGVGTDKSTWLAKVSAVLGLVVGEGLRGHRPGPAAARRVRRRVGGHGRAPAPRARTVGLRDHVPGRVTAPARSSSVPIVGSPPDHAVDLRRPERHRRAPEAR